MRNPPPRKRCVSSLLVLLLLPVATQSALAHGSAIERRAPPTVERGKARPETPDAATSRRSTAACCAGLLVKGAASGIQIEKTLEEGSVGAFPSRVESRAALAQAVVTALSAVAFDARAHAPQALAISEALGAAANTDGLSSSEIVAARAALSAALEHVHVTKEAVERIEQDFDRVVGDSRRADLKRVSSDLRAIEGEGAVTAAHARWLEDDLAKLVKEVPVSKDASEGGRPSDQSLHSLALDLSIALDETWLTTKVQARIVYALDAVLSRAAASEEAFAAVLRDVEDALDSAQVDTIETQLILSDLQGIHGETTPAPAK